MKKSCLSFLACAFLLISAEAFAYKPATINSIAASSEKVGRYGLFELTVDLSAEYENPFDPSQVDLSGIFKSPSSKEIKVPGFLYSSSGKRPVWKIRFSPDEEGDWTYCATVADKHSSARSPVAGFTCFPSTATGPVRVSKIDPCYFETSDGRFFFPVGMNVAWLGGDVLYNYDDYYKKIGSNGGNWTRLWLCSWGLGLEWKKDKSYGGLGVYNLRNADRIDNILGMAEKYGVRVQLTVNIHGQLSSSANSEWGANPYNKKNGGPCGSPPDFFTDETAKKLFKNRLRYIIARWGYSPAIFSWELWNEVDLTDNFDDARAGEWHKEMAEHIKSLDPMGHMITTSCSKPLDYGLWRAPYISYTQIHQYSDVMIDEIVFCAKEFRERYGKPVLIAEVASTAKEGTVERRQDPQGIRFHNALWSSAASPAAGTAMYWWWDSFIKPRGLFYELKAVSGFTAGDDRRGKKFTDIEYRILSPKDTYNTLTFTPYLDWQTSSASEIIVGNDGRVSGIDKLSRFFQGAAHKDMKVTPVFVVDYPEDGSFTLNIDMVSEGGAKAAIWLDDRMVLEHIYKPLPSYKHLDDSFEIGVSKGKHRIKITNDGGDWFRVRNICLSGYSNPLQVIGIRSEDSAYIWLKNRDDTVDNRRKGIRYTWIEIPRVVITGLRDGNYTVEYFDTIACGVVRSDKAECRNGNLELAIPTFTTDLGCKVKPSK